MKRLIIFSIENLRDSSVLTSLTVTFLSLCTLCRSDLLPLEPKSKPLLYVSVPCNKIPNMHLRNATFYVETLSLVCVCVCVSIQRGRPRGRRCQLVSVCSTSGQGNCFPLNKDRLIGCHSPTPPSPLSQFPSWSIPRLLLPLSLLASTPSLTPSDTFYLSSRISSSLLSLLLFNLENYWSPSPRHCP